MLSEDQSNVLVLLRDLSQSALSASEQAGYVTMINEALLKLADEAEEARLLGLIDPEQESFVKIARLRLVEAQRSATERFHKRRLAKVARLYGSSDTDLNEEPVLATDDRPASESEDDIAHGVRESKSESITKVLQRMHELAQAEVLKGELNISELDMSSKTLRELQEKYSGVDLLLNGSRRLVKILDEADKSDRRYMQLSLGFLAAVLVYIIYRRILSGPVKLLLWSLFQFIGVVKWFVPKQSSPQLAPPIPQSGVLSGGTLTQSTLVSEPTIISSVADSISEVSGSIIPDSSTISDILHKVTAVPDHKQQEPGAATETDQDMHSEHTQSIYHAEL